MAFSLRSFLYSGVWDPVSDQTAAGIMCSVHSTITSSHHFLDQQQHAPFRPEEVRCLLHILLIILSMNIYLLRMLVEIKRNDFEFKAVVLSSQHLRYLDTNSQFFFLISYELSRELEPPVDPCPGSPNPWSHRLITKKLTSWVLLFL